MSFFFSIYSSHNNSKYTYVKQCNFNKINVFLNKMCDILKLHYQHKNGPELSVSVVYIYDY